LRLSAPVFTVCARTLAESRKDEIQKGVMVFGSEFMTKKPLTSEQLTELTKGLDKLAHNLW